ncbi:Maf family protein [Sutcliffiella rhizosphaerae]|uniref:dTTP/UTP pyrophosphatase n=1 Tax=Sutcliffiella rhizosphaerae TaxID=2880967 RepID=A0ABN8A8S2_9BACI|nr:Maf family protein [Sutcliffiella rhizosphaerae]CAG9619503.1 dTTP/UTP pyrophosphatase [Sutcliffiella rhizosphaerae]
MKPLILASGSPRRKELLQQVHLPFQVKVSNIEETFDPSLSPEEIATSLAFQKANNVFQENKEAVVIGSDTIVVLGETVLGKPKDEDEARATLQKLSGHTHFVISGVSIVSAEKQLNFFEKTAVTFWELTEEDIDFYIKTGEPMDKAGSYGIQEVGALFVKEIKGDYFSIVGLPLSRTVRELKNFQ